MVLCCPSREAHVLIKWTAGTLCMYRFFGIHETLVVPTGSDSGGKNHYSNIFFVQQLNLHSFVFVMLIHLLHMSWSCVSKGLQKYFSLQQSRNRNGHESLESIEENPNKRPISMRFSTGGCSVTEIFTLMKVFIFSSLFH